VENLLSDGECHARSLHPHIYLWPSRSNRAESSAHNLGLCPNIPINPAMRYATPIEPFINIHPSQNELALGLDAEVPSNRYATIDDQIGFRVAGRFS
jgi:hypothetical protein